MSSTVCHFHISPRNCRSIYEYPQSWINDMWDLKKNRNGNESFNQYQQKLADMILKHNRLNNRQYTEWKRNIFCEFKNTHLFPWRLISQPGNSCNVKCSADCNDLMSNNNYNNNNKDVFTVAHYLSIDTLSRFYYATSHNWYRHLAFYSFRSLELY